MLHFDTNDNCFITVIKFPDFQFFEKDHHEDILKRLVKFTFSKIVSFCRTVMRGCPVTWRSWRIRHAISPVTWPLSRSPTRRCWPMPSTRCHATCTTSAGSGPSSRARWTSACRRWAGFCPRSPSKTTSRGSSFFDSFDSLTQF